MFPKADGGLDMTRNNLHQPILPERFLRWPEVKHRIGYSRSQIYLLIKQGSFPAPIKLGERASAWLHSSIDEWITSRIAESSKGRQP